MESAEDELRLEQKVPEVDQFQFPNEGNSNSGSEPGPGDKRDASEPVPDV